MKFDAFGTSKHHYPKIFFAILISTLGRFNRANKKKSVIYTLRVPLLQSSLGMEGFILPKCVEEVIGMLKLGTGTVVLVHTTAWNAAMNCSD